MSRYWKETFPLTPHPSESAGARRGSEWGEGVPVFSEPENPMFPQLTDSHRLLSGSGLFRFMLWPWRVEKEIQETSCSKCHRDPQSKDNMEPGDTTSVQTRTRWPREQGGCSHSGEPGRKPKTWPSSPRPIHLLESPPAILQNAIDPWPARSSPPPPPFPEHLLCTGPVLGSVGRAPTRFARSGW